MAKEFYVMDDESTVSGGVHAEPYIFKVQVEVFINKLAPLADPDNKLVFRIIMWCWDAEMDRKKRLAGIRYYPLQKKLTKITNRVERPYRVYNQKETIEAIDKTIQRILSDKEFQEEVKDTLDCYCPSCKRQLRWNNECACPLNSKIKPTWSK